jgi:hypothetical protein
VARDVERTCDCGMVIRCADVRGPVSFDPIYNEFHLTVDGRRHQILYCFNCGGKLPESTRDKRFNTPSPAECQEVAALMSRCRLAGDIVHELGPSDATSRWDALTDWPPGNRPWRRQFVYTRRWITLVLVVVEYADGSLSYGINGQPIVIEGT